MIFVVTVSFGLILIVCIIQQYISEKSKREVSLRAIALAPVAFGSAVIIAKMKFNNVQEAAVYREQAGLLTLDTADA